MLPGTSSYGSISPDNAKDQAAVAKADRRLFFAAAFAHGSARVLSKVASAPLERVKICLQVAPAPAVRQAYFQTPAALHGILASQGWRGLWRGSATHISAVCLGGLTRLGVLRTSQMWMMPGGGQQYEGFGAYARRCAYLYIAGVAALFVVYPLDVTYTCLAADQAQPRHYRGVVHFCRSTWREHGPIGLYRGLPLCLASAVPFILVSTAVHDVLAARFLQQMGQAPQVDHRAVQPGDLFWLARHGAPSHLYPWNLLVGAAAGTVAQAATYPLDTVRRRWQHSCTNRRAQAPSSWMEVAKDIYAQRGWRGFYAGYGANLLKLAPELLVLCGVYLQINASGNFV